jgi:hypothetical protein
MHKENLTWRTFADPSAVIGEKWSAGPATYYVIDHQGVIRYKWGGGGDEKVLDAALDRLIKEAEENAKKKRE